MVTKICTKCEKELDILCFHKDKKNNDGLSYICKECKKRYCRNSAPRKAIYDKQRRKSNPEKEAKRHKLYRKNNLDKIKQYNRNNAPKKAIYNKQYNKDHAKQISKQKKKRRETHPELIAEQKHRHYETHIEQIAESNKRLHKNNALFETYAKQLEQFEEVQRCTENQKLLEVKCAYCGKWLKPTNLQVKNRIIAITTIFGGENRFYCSESCKQSCPIYNQNKYPKDFKKATSREVVPLLRQLVLERDDYTCQKCGATTETAQLHVHHEKSYTLNKIMANDPDNCITLCKDCHKGIHSQKGCTYNNLKC